VDVSELIRVYGNVHLPEKQIPSVSHRENTQKNFPHEQLTAMQKELAEMKQAITLMLEDKTLREKENQQHEDEKNQLREEIKSSAKAWSRRKKRVLVQAVRLKRRTIQTFCRCGRSGVFSCCSARS
jgi:TolA-binding protein